MSIWDYLEPMGVKNAFDLHSSPSSQTYAWLVVVVNSLDTPLSLEKVSMWSGDQVGYSAIVYNGKAVAGTEDQIPGIRDHPVKSGVKLHPVGAWTFHSTSSDNLELAMRFSYKRSTGATGQAVGVAAKYKSLWHWPVSAQTANLDQFATPDTDTPEKILKAFFDARTGSQGDYYEIGSETTVWARVENHTVAPRESSPTQSVPQFCLVVWIRPS